MADITEILSTDSPSSSLGDINQNFENLNTDKIEADSSDVLSNKTIDADANTITDLTPANAKTANKTGVDTKFVTGTEGSNGELAMWNSDGDVVSADVALETSLTNSSTKVPTSSAVHAAIAEISTARELFLPALKHSVDSNVYSSSVGDYGVVQVDSGEGIFFVFSIPANFTTLTSVELVMIPDATESVQMDVSVAYGADGESSTNHNYSIANITKSVTSGNITKWRLDGLATLLFPTLAAGDVGTVHCSSDTTMLRVLGLLIKYA